MPPFSAHLARKPSLPAHPQPPRLAVALDLPPGLPLTLARTPAPGHREGLEETAQQTLLCWSQSEARKLTKMHKQMFDLGGEKEQERRLFSKAQEETVIVVGSSLFVLPVSSLHPDHIVCCEASGSNMGLILINPRHLP